MCQEWLLPANRALGCLALPLPNFFIVGAPKAGATLPYYYLSQHPDVAFRS
jgi:hypothetical protein